MAALNDAYNTCNSTYDTRVPRVLRQETTAGAGAQLLLLAALGTTVGLGPAGWLTGLAFTAATWALLTRALSRQWPPARRFGPANAVTLARTTLVGGVTALVAESVASGETVAGAPVVLLTGLTAVALFLDAVDGKVARRTGTASPLGARFDMEVDAFLIMVLSVYVATMLGAWVLLIGAMRYVFVAAARVAPWLNAPLPPSMARKTVAALQGVLLLTATTGALPRVPLYAVVLTALATLVWSFGRDILGLWHGRHTAAVAPQAPAVPTPTAHLALAGGKPGGGLGGLRGSR
ncbi:CDP-alcohol phosphatidyltransferase family protein [Streptomyces sp. NPDC093109]|uniref:CDP-alcohol phosphatidyltransferase family protein n=1 Tax=Streptomyces sp. NPDC093109 TaxID=3154977 RepID=UPI00344E83D7